MRYLLLFALLLPRLLHAQTICFTFDDGLDPRTNPHATTWNASLLAALAEAGVKAAVFPAGKIVDSPQGIALIRDWGSAGHLIGNHTYSHINYGAAQVTPDRFSKDILRQHALLGSLAGWANVLRFPYLKEGETATKNRSSIAGSLGIATAPLP